MLIAIILMFTCAMGHGPRVRHRAPDFQAPAVMPDFSFREVSLEDLTESDKWLLLVFYPADFTFVCPTELLAFDHRFSEFQERNVNVAFVSVDTKHTHLAWLNTPRKEGKSNIVYVCVFLIGRSVHTGFKFSFKSVPSCCSFFF